MVKRETLIVSSVSWIFNKIREWGKKGTEKMKSHSGKERKEEKGYK